MTNKLLIILSVSVLSLILLIACFNFFAINSTINESMKATQETDAKIEFILNKHSSLNSEDCQKLDSLKNTIVVALEKIGIMKNGVFESNLHSFLFSFFIAFLGGLLLKIADTARKQIDKAEKKLKRVDIEQTTMELFTQIQMLRIFSTQAQTALASNDESKIILINEVFVQAESILDELHNDQYKYITKRRKTGIDKIFENMIYPFTLIGVSENNEIPIEKTIDKLNELRFKILNIKEIKESEKDIIN